jgi:hypothetical protein
MLRQVLMLLRQVLMLLLQEETTPLTLVALRTHSRTGLNVSLLYVCVHE